MLLYIYIGTRGAGVANDNASQRSQDPFPDADGDDVEGADYDLNTSHILPGDDDDDNEEAFVIPGYEPTTTTTVKPNNNNYNNNNNNNGQSKRSSTRSEGGGLNPKNEAMSSNKGVTGAPVVFDLLTSSPKENILTL